MRLFKRKKLPVNAKQEELAVNIAGKIMYWQTRIAHYLNGKTKDLSGKSRLLLLIVFCVLFAAVNLYLLVHSINH